MKDTFWLVVNKTGVARIVRGKRPNARLPRAVIRPSLNAGEYAVFLSVDVPDSVFAPRPLPSATITIPESAVIAPPVSVDVASADASADDSSGWTEASPADHIADTARALGVALESDGSGAR